MAKKRGFKDAKKGFVNRRNGIMKKANTLHRLTGAHVAIMIEFNGTTYSYQSDTYFSAAVKDVHAKQKYGPDDFDTVADRGGPQASCSSDRPKETAAPLASFHSLTSSPSLLLPNSTEHPGMSKSGSSITTDSFLSSTSYVSAGINSTSSEPGATDFHRPPENTQHSSDRARLRDPRNQDRRFYPLAADFF